MTSFQFWKKKYRSVCSGCTLKGVSFDIAGIGVYL